MANKILLNIGYNRFIKLPDNVPPEFVVSLLGIKTHYARDYSTKQFKIVDNDSECLVLVVDESELPDVNPTVIEVNEIMLENNRLTRENEQLMRKIKELTPSEETALAVIE